MDSLVRIPRRRRRGPVRVTNFGMQREISSPGELSGLVDTSSSFFEPNLIVGVSKGISARD
jgi:hypothetical protein